MRAARPGKTPDALAALLGVGFAVIGAPPSRADDATACVAASAAVQRTSRLPPRLLNAIGIVESGRIDPFRHVVAPWPWSVNANGEGHMYDSKAQAITAVLHLQAAGIDSIDVGCMQINLHHHPDAFASLDQAFDPSANTAYASRFLMSLFEHTGSWPKRPASPLPMRPASWPSGPTPDVTAGRPARHRSPSIPTASTRPNSGRDCTRTQYGSPPAKPRCTVACTRPRCRPSPAN
jgi:hypothetical protein